VHAALDAGITFFDVAPYYGLTAAETVLGKALRGIDRDRYVLATKVGRYGDQAFDFSAAAVTRSVRDSLARLGVDHADLIQCHDVEFGTLHQVASETIPALRELQNAGLVRGVGITGYPLPALACIAARAPLDTVMSYCPYNLQDRRLAALADIARKVVGVSSVGTRCWIVLMLGRDSSDPLFLQVKEAGPSVLEDFAGASKYDNGGQRVVAGQRLMQAASDIFLGWQRSRLEPGGAPYDFYIRQLRDWKASADIGTMAPAAMRAYGQLCGWTLARAHARSGDQIAIAAHLGRSAVFGQAIAVCRRPTPTRTSATTTASPPQPRPGA
jgi:Uncharacterized protein conserved in bacteria (DUF2252)/Aldo/keto reductase family